MHSRNFRDSGLIYRAMLNTAALLIPCSEREEWLAEWQSELWYLLHEGNSVASFASRLNASVAHFCLGAFRDALWLRRHHSGTIRIDWMRSPISCMAILAILAALALALFESLSKPPDTGRPFLFGQVVVLAISLLLVWLSAPSPVADYLVPPHPCAAAARLYWWGFFILKSALVFLIVFCGTVDVGSIIAPGGILPHAALVSYVLGFRWALMDQRRRCRVCLRLLINPIRIGEASNTMLAWYGTELMCQKGHGLLHLPEMPAASYSTQQWLHLDHSWRDLFTPKAGRASVLR